MSNYPVGAEHDPRAPYNEVEFDRDCAYCGEPSERYYCSKSCYIAHIND